MQSTFVLLPSPDVWINKWKQQLHGCHGDRGRGNVVKAQVESRATGNGSISSRPWRPSRCHAAEQTGALAQQMELMMRNKRDHLAVVLSEATESSLEVWMTGPGDLHGVWFWAVFFFVFFFHRGGADEKKKGLDVLSTMLQIKEAGVWFCKNQKKKMFSHTLWHQYYLLWFNFSFKTWYYRKSGRCIISFLLHMDSCHQTAASWTDKNKSNLS